VKRMLACLLLCPLLSPWGTGGPATPVPDKKTPAPAGDWPGQLAKVMFKRFAEAPGYSEGPTWRDGDLFFCCNNGLMRIDRSGKVRKYLDLKPAGTLLRPDGSLLLCDNKIPALVKVTPEGKVGVLADRFADKPLGSLNDLTVDRNGNVYWTDPKDSSQQNPIGKIFRLSPEGKVDLLASDLAFPNGIEVDPENRYLYVMESQTAKILRYEVPLPGKALDKPVVFYAMGGSGGDGCAFDKEGNLWVADFHRPETGKGRLLIIRPEGEQAKVVGHVNVPAKQVSNITFGGVKGDEIFITTNNPPGVFHATVGVAGFPGHPGKALTVVRWLDLKPLDTPVPDK
jgi:gluconolactonase